MPVRNADGAPEELAFPDLLPHPDRAGDGELDRARGLDGGTRLAVEDEGIVVLTRGSAAGTLGPIQMAATASPDGYTVAQIPITVFRAPFMSRTTFDPTRDLTYVIGLTGYTFGVVVRDDAPWKTFGDLLADARRLLSSADATKERAVRAGLQLVAAIKGDYPLTPVVLMTAQGSEDIASEALRRGEPVFRREHFLAGEQSE